MLLHPLCPTIERRVCDAGHRRRGLLAALVLAAVAACALQPMIAPAASPVQRSAGASTASPAAPAEAAADPRESSEPAPTPTPAAPGTGGATGRSTSGFRVSPRQTPTYHAPQRIRPTPIIPSRIRASIWATNTRLRIGDEVRLFFRIDTDSRVYIFSTGADGVTHQIFPNIYDTDNFLRAGTYTIPDSNYRLVADGPVGREEISLLAISGERDWFPDYRVFPQGDPDGAFPRRQGGATQLKESLGARLQAEQPGAESPAPREIPKAKGRSGASSTSEEKSTEAIGPGTNTGAGRESSRLGISPRPVRPIRPGYPDCAIGEARVTLQIVGGRPRGWSAEPTYRYPVPRREP